MTYQNYEFTAFEEADLLQGSNGSNLDCGDVFVMPASATVCLTSHDDDRYLSGDYYYNEMGDDFYGQTVTVDGQSVPGQMYAEQYHVLYGSDGCTYYLVDIEISGSSDNYFTFYGAVPPEGTTLQVVQTCNVTSDWVDYNCLDAGEKAPTGGTITGRLFCDVDCDNTELNADTGQLEVGVEGENVFLMDAHGNIVTVTQTAADGSYSFTNVAPGDYYVKFAPADDPKEFVDANVGDERYDSDVTSTSNIGEFGRTDVFHISAGQTIDNIDAGIKAPTTTVAGTYFCDEDGDNVESAGDTGLEGKVIILADAHGNTVKTTTTDADGNYVFDDVVPGDYFVKFEVDPTASGFAQADQGGDPTIDSDVTSSDANFGRTDVFHVSVDCPQLNVDAGIQKATGTVSGTVFCDTDCDGLSTDTVIIPGHNYVIEAEHMHETGFHTVHSSGASGGAFEKLNCAGGNGEISSTFTGKDGVYDLTFFMQDENDGQSEIFVKINGVVVDTFVLDGDSDGAGSDHGPFSEFLVEGITINEGDEIKLYVDGDHGEFVRFDKIELKGQDQVGGETEVVTTTVAHEDFSTGAAGWSSDWVATDTSGNSYLTGAAHTYSEKSFDVPAGSEQVCLTFDFLEIDSWNCESFKITINGHTINLGEFYFGTDEGAYSFDAGNGITVEKAAAVDISGIGANNSSSAWHNDNKHSFTITIDNPSTHLNVGFSSHLSGDIHDESWGVDNLKIEAKTVVPVSEPVKEGVEIKLIDAAGNTIATTFTDENGNYEFTDVPVGEYKIMGTAPDGTEFTIQDVDNNSQDDIDSDVDENGMSGTITVTDGGTVDIDLGVCEKTGEIRGRLFIDTDNDDQDNNNGDEPGVEGQVVRLLDGDGNEIATTLTLADGSYEFLGLGTGDYIVDFPTEVDGRMLVNQNVGAPESDSDASQANGQTGIISLNNGDIVTDIDAGIEDPETASISGRYFCDENDNDVDDGEPAIANVTVILLDAAGMEVTRTLTETDGSYTFDGLAAGTYSVAFAADPDGKVFVAKDDPNGNGSDANDSDVNPDGTTDPIVLGAAETVENVDAGVEDPGTAVITGRYFCDENNDATQQNGAGGLDIGVVGATVILLQNGLEVARTETIADGVYVFENLDAGDYTVVFEDPEDAGETGKTFVAADQGSDDLDSDVVATDANDNGVTAPVSVAIGETVENVDAGIEALLGTVSGRYFCDEDGNGTEFNADENRLDVGVANATVILFKDGIQVDQTTTDSEGNYTFTNVVPGSGYQVAFQAPDASGNPGKVFVTPNSGDNDSIDSDVTVSNGSVDDGLTDAFDVDPNEDVTNVDGGIEDPGTASIGDRVFIDADGNGAFDAGEAGLGGVRVALLDADGNELEFQFTDSQGFYNFAGLDAGDYSVLFEEADGFDFTTQNAAGEAVDSDADTTTGRTDTITLAIGEVNLDVDAGLVVENADPTPEDDAAMFCADDVLSIDVLANDDDPDGDTISLTAINGVSVVPGQQVITSTGVVVTFVENIFTGDTSLVIDAEAAYESLDIDDTAFETITYTVTDSAGNTSDAVLDLTIKGDANSVESFYGSLPTSGGYQLEYAVDTPNPDGTIDAFAFDLRFINTGDERFDGVLIEEAYCLDFATAVRTLGETNGGDNVGDFFGSQSAEALAAFDSNTLSTANGLSGAENLDLINWVIAQDFEAQGFSGWEVQFAIWELADNFDASLVNYSGFVDTDLAGVETIVDQAILQDGFEFSVQDTVSFIVDPASANDPENVQPFIVALTWEDYDCLCAATNEGILG